ncbi:MAG: RNA chaperone Hfq [Oscillospiraceae bacterium]|jgi:host factor-I protein|nr:RNA chaperone Hfq [Oscillospiraceae bacterium]
MQDVFLNRARAGRIPVKVFLLNGFQIRGIITAFDNFTLALDVEGQQQIVFKHAVSTIIPSQSVSLAPEVK